MGSESSLFGNGVSMYGEVDVYTANSQIEIDSDKVEEKNWLVSVLW